MHNNTDKSLPADGLAGLKQYWTTDATSGLIVFLLALPLSRGIMLGWPMLKQSVLSKIPPPLVVLLATRYIEMIPDTALAAILITVGIKLVHPRLTRLFMLACLGIAGFPITPTFIGEDLILGHVQEHQFGLTLLIALGLILDGLAVFRIYARLFLGPHEKGYHEVAYRSS